jgi:hypothetical protein
MDFVSRLINEGYSEEDIGDILESLYLIEKNGGGSVIMEEQEYIVEVRGFLARQLAKLRGLPQTPAIQKQIKRLERLVKGGKDKVDDVAKKGDDVAGTIVKKADDVVDATKPPTASSPTRTRPSGAPVRQAGQTPTGKPAPKPKSKPDVTPVKPKSKSKPSNKLPGWAKTAGLAGLGALGYNVLTGDGKDSDSDSDSSTSTSTTTPTTPTETKPKDPTAGLPQAPFWWSKQKPKTLGYQMQPSLRSYRNVREDRNEAYEIVLEYLIDGGHADTIEEANYIMMQMEFEHFIDIVEGK